MQRKGELKFVDILTTNNIISTTATFTLINGLVSGATETNRIGRKIMMKSLHFTGRLIPSGNQAAANPPGMEYLRMIIVYDRQPNAAVFATADVLQSTDQAATTATTSLDHFNMSNAERFKIVRDLRISIQQRPMDATLEYNVARIGQQTFPGCTKDSFGVPCYEQFIKLNGLETHYNNGSAGTVADITSGSLYVFTLGNVAVANACYSIQWTARLRYWDH